LKYANSLGFMFPPVSPTLIDHDYAVRRLPIPPCRKSAFEVSFRIDRSGVSWMDGDRLVDERGTRRVVCVVTGQLSEW
jgi:hypothetical protein